MENYHGEPAAASVFLNSVNLSLLMEIKSEFTSLVIPVMLRCVSCLQQLKYY